MPTPVATARQCLTEESGRALDDAVSVAKRRNHAQTTSLHAISALLSPSFSLLRDSLSRARSSAYSPRLQFRALELCVGVSLDRLPSSKSQNDNFAPPISNSLMAAIKRSQANQRRQPDMYHFNQINTGISISSSSSSCNSSSNSSNSISISSIKVELKHLVLSILDDPIVSRVFADAGFRSNDIKIAIIHPPLPNPAARWGPARCPPVFLCNLMDFSGGLDENCRRIGEIMVRKRERNPLLVGVCAKDAIFSFEECLEKGRFEGLPSVIHGVKIVSLEKEICGFVEKKEKQVLDLKIKEVGLGLQGGGSVNGVVVSLGELKVLVREDGDVEKNDEFVKELVEMISGLVEMYGNNKLWLIGGAANYETYSKFVGKFPTVEKKWDLHPLPITSSRSSFDALGSSKSSLMGSFVPFGGFFPTPSDFRPQLTTMKRPFTRCNSCDEMYHHELSVLREGPSVSISDKYPAGLPSWLQSAEPDLSKGAEGVMQVKDMKASSNEKIAGLQRKWDDHCQRLHQNPSFSAPGVPLTRPQPQTPHNLAFHIVSSDKQGGGSSNSSGDTSLTEGACSNSSSGLQILTQNIPPQHKVPTLDFPRRVSDISECRSSGRESPASLGYPIQNLASIPGHRLPSLPVTTDLGLGMIYASKLDELKKPSMQHFGGSVTSSQGTFNEKYCKLSDSGLREGFNPGDYKSLLQKLSEAVAWQYEAASKISQIVSFCRSGNELQRSTNVRRGVWLTFLGPDKVGKRRVAEALADSLFGSRNHLIVVDLSSQDRSRNIDSLFVYRKSTDFNITLSRLTAVDHIAQELSKKPNSVVFLENIDEADPLVRSSLSRAIQTGKFQDSCGRELRINNVIFVATSIVKKDDRTPSPRKEFIKFTEETILEAKNWQMRIEVRTVSGDNTSTSDGTRVSLVSSTKRKAMDTSDPSDHVAKKPKNALDLNLPLDEPEEASKLVVHDGSFLGQDSRAWLEDFMGQADGNVVFKPFDFDALADKLMRKIRLKFEEMLKGERRSLEIDYEVMVQILAASWCSDIRGAIDDWIEQVLGACFAETRERYPLTPETVVSLFSCVGEALREDWASGICLPKSINLRV